MNKARTKTREERLEAAHQSVKAWKAGKAKLRTWRVDDAGNREASYQSYEEYRKEKQAGKKLQAIRRGLGLSQRNFSQVMRISVRTLQGWEAGKSVPTPALVLAELLRDSKDVRRRLVPELAE
jgi:DNA-binding transcriptional regulator YiaG